ncbi:MAG: ATP-dependent RNA helicase RhlE [Gemmatimonadota bacterium]|nr:MAG: ATP-dependent RNA helicase RhlE [Gemmatimonadota bacterium]
MISVSKKDTRTGFDKFGLKEALLRGVRGAGFENPRPIQAETIPAGLKGRDVLGLAQTGTGKTAAFALPLLQRILEGRGGKGPRALVLAPTRELATQISEEIRTLSRFTPVRMITIYGGVSIHNQIGALRARPDIVVGCPGRVLDLLQQRKLRLDEVETLVLDEADHMFDMGFLPDIRKILSALPRNRQNLLFSATMPKEIRRLADDLLSDPQVVELADAMPASTIDHALFPVAEGRKRDLLEHLLRQKDCDSAIVFTRTKHRARRLAEQLEKAGHRAVGLQGNMSQGQRDRAMKGFRARRFDILVATDIAARGIDVSGVSHVINYDVPNTPEAYTHRIGRTGRSECEGIACTFVTSADTGWVRATERMIGAPIQRRKVEGFETEKFLKLEPAQSARPRPRPRPRPGASATDPRPEGQARNRRSRPSRGRSRKRAA